MSENITVTSTTQKNRIHRVTFHPIVRFDEDPDHSFIEDEDCFSDEDRKDYWRKIEYGLLYHVYAYMEAIVFVGLNSLGDCQMHRFRSGGLYGIELSCETSEDQKNAESYIKEILHNEADELIDQLQNAFCIPGRFIQDTKSIVDNWDFTIT